MSDFLFGNADVVPDDRQYPCKETTNDGDWAINCPNCGFLNCDIWDGWAPNAGTTDMFCGGCDQIMRVTLDTTVHLTATMEETKDG